MRGERRRQRSHPWTTTDPTPSIRSGPARGEDAQIGHRAGDPDRRLGVRTPTSGNPDSEVVTGADYVDDR
jgi:hypothetical protein